MKRNQKQTLINSNEVEKYFFYSFKCTFYMFIGAGSQVTMQLSATHTPQVESLTKDPTCVKPIVADTGDGQSSTQVH